MAILITGAAGQIGSELTDFLKLEHPGEQIIASDLRPDFGQSADTTILDVTDSHRIETLFSRYRFDRVYHLAAILSGTGEKNPDLAYEVNLEGTRNILNAAVKFGTQQVFVPSSIAVFGRGIERNNTRDDEVLKPSTMYGITKVATELLFDYYRSRYQLDVRSLRFPGVISWKTEPGGGSTDYAVDIFHQAIAQGRYTSFVCAESTLPFMYMPDVIRSIELLMAAPRDRLSRTVYNVTSFSASCSDFARSVAKRIPGFSIGYEPDFRQEIVDRWPRQIDDTPARTEWNWNPGYNLDDCADDMLKHLGSTIATSVQNDSYILL